MTQSRDGYTPNYEQECSRCGTTPCVDVVRNGMIRHSSELCGVCFFDDRLMIDPEEWNNQQEE